MYKIYFTLLLSVMVSCRSTNKLDRVNTIPPDLVGNFKDDYGISYTMNNKEFVQHPGTKYHLISYNKEKQYFIARNDDKNPGEAGLYSRIDIMYFQNMQPYVWGFCLTAYKARTKEEA
ncbi:MAG TPA: hypothetical protein VMZ03_09620, partial [Chitinophagaceae bacterium]|nr:hypothetical protein [Chitinophagaceae bacterium]